jgi:hypothetical protein
VEVVPEIPGQVFSDFVPPDLATPGSGPMNFDEAECDRQTEREERTREYPEEAECPATTRGRHFCHLDLQVTSPNQGFINRRRRASTIAGAIFPRPADYSPRRFTLSSAFPDVV